MNRRTLVVSQVLARVAVLTCCLCCGAALAGPDSNNNPRLRRVLGRFPQAEANGDKSNLSPVRLEKCMDNGIAVAAVNYRL